MIAALIAIGLALTLIIGSILALRPGRASASQVPLPEDWRRRLDTLLPRLASLSPELRQRHAERVQAFLGQVHFIGCDGLTVVADMRLAIAGYACLLALRPEAALYPRLRSVLVYPGAFLVPVAEPDEWGLVADQPEERVGESWQGDRVIVSWEDVAEALEGGPTNVVVHEFAHQLDDQGPDTLGAPPLTDYRDWSRVMSQEFERLRRHRRPPVLDPYGAESPAEFFAVVSEAFIQRGPDLKRHHPEMYRLLADYFGFETGDAGAADAAGPNSRTINGAASR